MKNSRWSEGEDVRVRAQAWTVATVTPHAGCAALHLREQGGTALTILTPFDRPQRIPRSSSPRRVHLRRWLHVVRRAACEARGFGDLADPPAITLLPYQLEPALAFLRHGATRVLIADGVGLGKTVQSGLLLHTLAARQPLLRALVITPAGLREQWARELAARFAISATLADAAWLRASDRALPGDVAPWALPGVFVTSFDFVKRPEVLRPLENLTWDLLIVDEAHNATVVSARRAAIDATARRALRVVLLTATPHAGDTAQFDALCAIGATRAREPIVVFRRSRADVAMGSARRSVMLRVTPTAGERRLHRLLDRYARAICRESRARADVRPRLIATILKKRALSSAASLGVSVKRRLDLLAGAPPVSQLLLPLGEDEAPEDEVDDTALGAPGLGNVALEQRLLKTLARAADEARAESKPAFLLRFLRRAREPAIVFTEFRDTLARLHHLLTRAGHEVTLLHGGLLPRERSAAQRRFNDGGGVLLATDAASEGLNLHERCRLVVHYELPWTPARLEQRTGRVDRIGQMRTVHEVLLVAGHAAERLVLAPLARRAARVRSALGGDASVLDHLSDSLVADAVLDGLPLAEPGPVDTISCCSLDLRPEAVIEAHRLTERRAWIARSSPRPRHTRRPGVVLGERRRRRRSTRVYVYSLAMASHEGRVEHREIVAFRSSSDVHPDAVLRHLAPRITRARDRFALVRRSLDRRACALVAQLPSASRSLVQAGLFDRRAVLASHHRALATARMVEDLETPAAPALELSATLRLIAILQE